MPGRALLEAKAVSLPVSAPIGGDLFGGDPFDGGPIDGNPFDGDPLADGRR
jgi:hypothetical protein